MSIGNVRIFTSGYQLDFFRGLRVSTALLSARARLRSRRNDPLKSFEFLGWTNGSNAFNF